LGVNFIVKKRQYNKKINLDIYPEQVQVEVKAVESVLEPLDNYLDIIKKRDIFKPQAAVKKEPKVEETQPKKEEEKPKEPTIKELISDYSLVGISWSDNPDAMIEDSKEKVTYFFKEGQTLKNGVKIKKIYKDKVILEYKQQEATLE